MKNITLIVGILSISFLHGFTQTRPNYISQPSTFIVQNFEVLDSSGWFQVKADSNLSLEDIISFHHADFGLDSGSSWVQIKSNTDSYPFTTDMNRFSHYIYKQYFNNIELEFAQLAIHTLEGNVQYISNKVCESFMLPVTPQVTEYIALQQAVGAMGSNNSFVWLDEEYENQIKEETGDSNATYYPVGKLIYAYVGNGVSYEQGDYRLAWKFNLTVSNPLGSYEIYIDALNGNYLKTNPLICYNSVPGTADLLYYGNKPIDSQWRGAPNWNHRLYANDNDHNIITKWATYKNNGTLKAFNLVSNVTDNDDCWDGGDDKATTPHWAATTTWDFFKVNYNQWGINDNNGELRIFANSADHSNYWSKGGIPNNSNTKDYIVVGKDNGSSLCAIDLIGHEFTHGVIHSLCGFANTKEPGALGEGIGNLFGFLVEKYAQNGVIGDWTIGEDANYIGTVFSNPSSMGQPVFYGIGQNWFDMTNCTPVTDPTSNDYNDGCHIHRNCAVHDYWFYLLSQGSQGALDGTYNSYLVNGIGADKVGQIVYYAMANGLQPNSQYSDARNQYILAAKMIFGQCSNEARQTNNAWAAVNIGVYINDLKITGPNTIYRFSNGSIFGSMPIYHGVGGVSGPCSWMLNSNWQFSTSGSSNENLSVTSFMNNLVGTTIQLNKGCEVVTKNVGFNCIDCPATHPGDNGGGYSLRVFPNPTRDDLHFDANYLNPSNEYPITVTIIDLNGIYRYQNDFYGELPDSIDIHDLAGGTYILVVDQNQKVQQLRFTKE